MIKAIRVITLSLIVLLALGSVNSMVPVSAQQATFPDVGVSILRAFWGTDENSPTEGLPGDKNAPLTLVIKNQLIWEILGVDARIFLSGPLVTPSKDVVAVGFTSDVIKAGGTAKLTVIVDISPDATPGSYSFPVGINYRFRQDSTQDPSTPQFISSGFQISISDRLPIQVADSRWGTSNGELAAPGDRASILSLTLQNSAPYTISGLSANLILPNNFTSKTGGSNAVSYLSSELESGDATTATFVINIPEDVDVGPYGMYLKLSFVNELYKSKQIVQLNFTAFLAGRSFVEVSLEDRFLVIGATNPLSFEISNIGSAPLLQVTATLSIVTGRVATTGSGTTTNISPTGGNQKQFFRIIGPGESVLFPVEITIDPSVAESSMTAVLSLRYTDVTGTAMQENHNLGLVTTGAISMILQDAAMTPRAGFPGANVSLSGTILNQGNEPALYTSISLRGGDVVQAVRRGPPSDQYIGQIDPNTPLPFSLNFRINPDITPGRHQITLVMEFQTNYLITQTLEEDITIFIREGGAPTGPQTTGDEDSRDFGPLGVFLGIILASILGGLFLYRRSKATPDDLDFGDDDTDEAVS
ncbi:MAG: hypothetical protein O6846_01185 [Thaumarchaeota archaeon]|nr:hypothetical protein [Nitrososphaerota archaeon]